MTVIDGDVSERDYAGAIYGSLLAASVVAGTTPARGAVEPWGVAILLIATGVVFWLAHVYAHLVGASHAAGWMGWANIRHVAMREGPIAWAVLPPATAVFLGPLVGMSDSASAWLALGVAVAGQTAWAMAATVAAGASRWAVALSMTVNLLLGLTIAGLKTLLPH